MGRDLIQVKCNDDKNDMDELLSHWRADESGQIHIVAITSNFKRSCLVHSLRSQLY